MYEEKCVQINQLAFLHGVCVSVCGGGGGEECGGGFGGGCLPPQ